MLRFRVIVARVALPTRLEKWGRETCTACRAAVTPRWRRRAFPRRGPHVDGCVPCKTIGGPTVFCAKSWKIKITLPQPDHRSESSFAEARPAQ